MAVFSGKNGSLLWDSTTVTRVRNWSIQSTFDTLEVTDLGDDARAYVPGLKAATGSATIYYHDDNTSLKNLIDNCITTGVPSSAVLDLRWEDQKLVFNAYINSVSITCSTGEVMSAEISFTMTGDYTTVTL